MLRFCTYILIVYVLTLSFADGAAPFGRGNRDLLLCSSLGFDRSPCSLEWWQYNPEWMHKDNRYLRLTNETWTDMAYGNLFVDGKYYLLTSVDNSRGYSAVVGWIIDEYGQLQCKGRVLPNEPWRRYNGVAVCDLNKDGVSEILTIAFNKSGQLGVICFKKDQYDQRAQETMILKLESRACGLACLDSGPDSTDLFLIYPGNREKGGRIGRYMVSTQEKIISTNSSFLHIEPQFGEAGGIACEWDEKRQSVRMVLSTHDWGEADVADNTSASFKTNTEFILPGDINHISSYLYHTEFVYNKIPVRLIKFDSIKARRWRGVTFINNVNIPQSPQYIVKHKGGSGIMQLSGIFYHHYHLEAVAKSLGMNYTKHGVKHFQQMSSIPDYNFDDLSQYDAIFIINVSLWAIGGHGVRALESYVQSGGTLVFCDGPFAGKSGGYCDSSIEDILPVEINGSGFKVIDSSKLQLSHEYCELLKEKMNFAVAVRIWKFNR